MVRQVSPMIHPISQMVINPTVENGLAGEQKRGLCRPLFL
jgi:hypothetical protein